MPRFAGHDPVVPIYIQEERLPEHSFVSSLPARPASPEEEAKEEDHQSPHAEQRELLGAGEDLRAASSSAFQEILRLLDEAHHRTMQVLAHEGDALRNSIVEISQQQRRSDDDEPKEALQLSQHSAASADSDEVMPFCDKDVPKSDASSNAKPGSVALWAKLRAANAMQPHKERNNSARAMEASEEGGRHSLISCRSHTTPLSAPGSVNSQDGSTGKGSTSTGRSQGKVGVQFQAHHIGPIEVPTQDIQETIREFLDLPSSSRYAYSWSWVWLGLVCTSSISPIIQVMAPPPTVELEWAAAFSDLAFDIVFLLEALLRFACYARKLAFFRSPSNVIDVLSTLPIIPRCAYGLRMPEEQSTVQFLLLFVAPTVRLLKLVRGFQDMFLLFAHVFSLTWEVLRFLLFILLVIVVAASTIIFQVEPRSNISTFGRSIWLSTVTMTTVGYGDIIPKSAAGIIVVSLLMVLSVGFIAMPVGILGNAFTQVWSERDRIVIRSKTKTMLTEWGYSFVQIPEFFSQYDLDGDGSLTLREFRLMLDDLRVKINEDRSAVLFSSLDLDGDGTVDQQEFVRSLFPYAYHLLYGGRETGKSTRVTVRKSVRVGS